MQSGNATPLVQGKLALELLLLVLSLPLLESESEVQDVDDEEDLRLLPCFRPFLSFLSFLPFFPFPSPSTARNKLEITESSSSLQISESQQRNKVKAWHRKENSKQAFLSMSMI